MARVADIFSDFKELVDKEHEIRDEIRVIVRDIEKICREISMILQTVHHVNGMSQAQQSCQDTKQHFDQLKVHFSLLAEKVVSEHYYRFNDMWRFSMQKAAFLAAFVIYVQSEQLATREQVAQMIGVHVTRTSGFHLDLEDYLMSLLNLASELSRLAVNSVTSGDYHQPFKISHFIAELDSGFRLLNLKNDSLRKKYDSLKYNLKKVEEVVYDLTIRQLKPHTDKSDNNEEKITDDDSQLMT